MSRHRYVCTCSGQQSPLWAVSADLLGFWWSKRGTTEWIAAEVADWLAEHDACVVEVVDEAGLRQGGDEA